MDQAENGVTFIHQGEPFFVKSSLKGSSAGQTRPVPQELQAIIANSGASYDKALRLSDEPVGLYG
jgi:hypothetical protein